MPRKSTSFSSPLSPTASQPIFPSMRVLSVLILFAVALLHYCFSSSQTSFLSCVSNRSCPSTPDASSTSRPLLFYALGCLTPSVFMPAARRLAGQVRGRVQPALKERTGVKNSGCGSDRNRGAETGEPATASLLYGLGHRVLNAQIVLPETMWMNMGYWKVSCS